jgi:hypothetical protein
MNEWMNDSDETLASFRSTLVRNRQYASDNNLRGTPRVSRKKPNAGRSPTCRLWTADANSHIPCHAHAALCRGLEKSLSERHGRGMAGKRHGMCESNTATLFKSNWKVKI